LVKGGEIRETRRIGQIAEILGRIDRRARLRRMLRMRRMSTPAASRLPGPAIPELPAFALVAAIMFPESALLALSLPLPFALGLVSSATPASGARSAAPRGRR